MLSQEITGERRFDTIFTRLIIKNKVKSITQISPDLDSLPTGDYMEFDTRGNMTLKATSEFMHKYRWEYDDKNRRTRAIYYDNKDTAKIIATYINTFAAGSIKREELRSNGEIRLTGTETYTDTKDTLSITEIDVRNHNEKRITKIFYPAKDISQQYFISYGPKSDWMKIKSYYSKYDDKKRLIEEGRVDFEKGTEKFIGQSEDLFIQFMAGNSFGREILNGTIKGEYLPETKFIYGSNSLVTIEQELYTTNIEMRDENEKAYSTTSYIYNARRQLVGVICKQNDNKSVVKYTITYLASGLPAEIERSEMHDGWSNRKFRITRYRFGFYN